MLPGIVGYDETRAARNRKRRPRRPSHDLSGRARPGEIAHHPARWPTCSTSTCRRSRAARSTTTRIAPICGECRAAARRSGDELEIAWIAREHRYAEKLATPDVSVADLIGEIDPIKVAEGRYLADEETIHYGLIPRTNRGIFAINELPDLTEKVQVGLFNLMEEKDVQIKGYKIRLPVDVVFVASANPEDYTSRGRIITPLKDRFDVQIRTHYPQDHRGRNRDHGAGVRAIRRAPEMPLRVPQFMKDILAQITFEARASNEINQTSGVSVRVTINNFESADLQRREARGASTATTRSCRGCPICTRSTPRPPARSNSNMSARTRRKRT